MKELKGLKLGVALCGSFCTFSKAIQLIEQLIALEIQVFPIMSEVSYTTSTRFGKASDINTQIETLTGRNIIHTLVEAEPLGPKNMIDALLIAPCTGNSLAKLTFAITDTPVLLAANATLFKITLKKRSNLNEWFDWQFKFLNKLIIFYRSSKL